MRRKLLGIAAAGSVLLFVWACVVWPASYGSRASARPTTFAVQASLGRTLPMVRFDQVGLYDVLAFLRDMSGLNIHVDWAALEKAGINRNDPVNSNQSGVSVGEVMTRVVLQVGKIGYATRDNVLVIAPKDKLREIREAENLPAASGVEARAGKTGAEGAAGVWLGVIAGTFVIAIAVMGCIALRKNKREAAARSFGWIAAAALLVGALLVAYLTYQHGPPFWEKASSQNRWTLTAHRGELRLWHSPADPAAPYQDLSHLGRAKAADEQKVFDEAGFIICWSASPFNTWVVGMPLWGLVVLAGILPSLCLAPSIRRWRRNVEGKCPNCGYDLRASPDRCPECGAAIPTPAGVGCSSIRDQ